VAVGDRSRLAQSRADPPIKTDFEDNSVDLPGELVWRRTDLVVHSQAGRQRLSKIYGKFIS
jgi:hypothetical protein